LQYNRCPAVAPVGVLEGDGWKRIGLDLTTIDTHRKTLLEHPDFAEKIRAVMEQRPAFAKSEEAEARLYDGFINGPDKLRIETVRNADARQLADFHPQFDDERLSDLLLRYKARNYAGSMSEDEVMAWEAWRGERLHRQLPAYLKSLQRLATSADDTTRFVLEELQLWAEAIMPEPESV
jgi:exodeoxyribonuclease-1